MSGYLANAVWRTLWCGTLLVGVPIAIAWLLQGIGDKIRTIGVSQRVFGHYCVRAYCCFVAVGVACHETGHAVGTLITGNKVLEFVPFTLDSKDYIGFVRHTIGSGIWGRISSAIIGTGPIWFGGIVIVLLTRFLVGESLPISFHDYFASGDLPGLVSYLSACLRCAIGLCVYLLGGAVLSGWRVLLWAYLVFCIASEIGMSSVDFAHSRVGLALMVGIVLVLLLLPLAGNLVATMVAVLLPEFFVVHVLMILAVFINAGFLLLEKLIVRML